MGQNKTQEKLSWPSSFSILFNCLVLRDIKRMTIYPKILKYLLSSLFFFQPLRYKTSEKTHDVLPAAIFVWFNKRLQLVKGVKENLHYALNRIFSAEAG